MSQYRATQRRTRVRRWNMDWLGVVAVGSTVMLLVMSLAGANDWVAIPVLVTSLVAWILWTGLL